jgi:hypothetical protein
MTNDLGPINAANYPHALTPLRLRPRRRRRLIIGGLCLVVVVAALVVVLTGTKNSSAAAAVKVRRALSATLASRSMAYTLNESVTASSTTINVAGNGVCDLTNAECKLTMNYGGALSSIGTVSAIISNGVIYLELGPSVRDLLPTPWVSMSLTNSASASLGVSGNPLAGLSYLAQQGAVVTDEGTVSLANQSVTQYDVSIGSSAAQHIVSSGLHHLPSWVAKAVPHVSVGAVTETVDVDSQGRLAYVSATSSETIAGTAVSSTASETVTGYGMTVQVSVPPANQVSSAANLTKLTGL